MELEGHLEDARSQHAQAGEQKWGKSARKRKRQRQASQEELDARHPGNARNRAAILHISSAFGWYKEWLSKQQDEPHQANQDLPQAAKPAFGGTLFPPDQQQKASTSEDHHKCHGHHHHHQQQQQQQQAWHVQALPCCSSPAQDSLAYLSSTMAPAAASEAQEVDWIALGQMRQVLKPKVKILSQEEVNALSVPDLHGSSQQQEGQQQVQACTHHHHEHRHHQQLQQHQQHHRHQPQNLFNSLVCNPSTQPAIALAHESVVWLPPRSRFIMGDLMDARTLAPLLPQPGCTGTYKCIVLDPPWENASVKRSGRYQTLPSRNLLKLPIPRLLHPDGIVCLWITNREKLWRFVQHELLPAWRLRHAATWWWLKMDASGTQPILPLHSMHRHPFEAVLVLTPDAGSARQPASQPHAAPTALHHHVTAGSAQQPASQPPTASSDHATEVPAKDAEGAGAATAEQEAHDEGRAGMSATAEQAKGAHARGAPDSAQGSVGAQEAGEAQTLSQFVQPISGQCSGAAAQQACVPHTHSLGDGTVFMSVPAAEHSRKPHLGPLLERVLSAKQRKGNGFCDAGGIGEHVLSALQHEAAEHGSSGKLGGGSLPCPGDLQNDQGDIANERLELFARELHEGWDAVSDEVLRFQQLTSPQAAQTSQPLTVVEPVGQAL